MKTLTERLNTSTRVSDFAHATTIDVHKNVCVYGTMCVHCVSKDIDVADVADEDFDSCMSALEDAINAARGCGAGVLSFWFDTPGCNDWALTPGHCRHD
jgi:hypothetical protein